MRQLHTAILAIFLVLNAISISAQSITTQDAMHSRVVALYNFSPHTISDTARATKSKEMDAFWDIVKANPQVELPLLRKELADPSDPAFFMVDGSTLLLSLSHARPDEDLAAAAMARSDLKDVDSGAYFYAIHALSMDGVDTTAPAMHVLDDPNFAVIVPQHALTLDQGSVLMYLLLPVDQAKWIGAARSRFASEKSDVAAKSLLSLFFYTQTKEGDAALAAAATDPSKNASVHANAKEYQKDVLEARKAKYDVTGSEATIREDRRKRLGAVSDEAIDDVQEMTGRIIQLRSQTH